LRLIIITILTQANRRNQGLYSRKSKRMVERARILLAVLASSSLLVACGGTPDGEENQPLNQAVAGGAPLNTHAASGLSTDSFGNFNPAIWDSQAWYECNCGRNPAPAQPTPWSPNE
jgi:hypothetical protein